MLPAILAKLVDHTQHARIIDTFTNAINASFIVDGGVMTRSAVKDRFEICVRVFLNLRGDLKWSLARALDMLPAYLRCELEGVAYDPSAHSTGLWAPTSDDDLAH